MMAFLTKPWSIFSRPAVEPTQPPPTLPPAKSLTPAAVAASAPPQSPDQRGSMPLGLEGYCPVTLVERGTWVEGRAQWGARHRGRTYLFAGPEQQQAFLASPDRYAPALSGDDPVLAFESGRSEPGRRAYGVTYQSRMYLFSTPETRAAFSADPGRYTARVMIAEGLVANDGTRRF
jgi:protein disulfide-isomerase